MKILKFLLLSIAVLILLLVVAAIVFVKTFDVNRFKPQIINQVSRALSREVDFGKAKLGISLIRGISLAVNNLAICEDPVFGKGEFLAVKDVSLGVDALGYIFQKKISISSILIDSPRITIIRQKDGSLNVQSLAKAAAIEKEKEAVKPVPAAALMAVPAILISSIKGDKGRVMFIDHSFEPALRLEISDLNFSVSKISLTGAFPFVIEGAVLSSKKNIRVEGRAHININENVVTIFDLKGTTELSEILLKEIPVSFPMAKGAVLPLSLKGKVDMILEKLIVGPKGLTDLSGDVTVANGSMQFKELASPVQDIGMNIKITEKKILFDRISAAIGEGLINGSGSIEDYLVQQDYSASVNVQNLKLQDLIAMAQATVQAEGIASAKIKVKGQGLFPEALASGLSGEADISVTKAKLKDINVLRTVLDKISVIPGLAEKIEANLPERFKQKLTQKDTVVSDIKLPVVVENSRFIVREAVLGSDEFLFKGKGQAGLDGAYSLEGSFLIPQELSMAMVASVKELQYLLNEEKQIYIPLKVSGKAGALDFRVDAQYIAQKLLTDEAKQQIFKALDKALGVPSPGEQDATPQDASQEKSAVKEAVGSLLDKILKK